MRARCTKNARRLASCIGFVAAVGALSACSWPTTRPTHVLLITVDTLRADVLGRYGGRPGLTPALDALAGESLVFTAAYAPTSLTLPSLTGLLSGRHPEEIGVHTNDYQHPQDVPTLATLLRARGWRTAAVVSSFVLRAGCGLDSGFEVYDARLPQQEAVRHVPERLAPDTTNDALQMLDRLRREDVPLFLWIHYQDPHGPYTPPDPIRQTLLQQTPHDSRGPATLPLGKNNRGLGAIPRYQFLNDRHDVRFYRAGYEAEVHFMDQAIGRLVEGLRERGIWEEAVVVFAADHGEALGENDYWFAHGEHLTDPLVRVPLLFKVPGRAPATRSDVAALLDVSPTLLHLLGAAAAGGGGRDLLAPDAPSQASTVYLATLGGSTLPRIGVISDGHKLILTNEVGQWRPQLFALGAETEDVAGTETGVALRLQERIGAIRSSMERRGPAPPRTLTADQIEKLRALGYVGD